MDQIGCDDTVMKIDCTVSIYRHVTGMEQNVESGLPGVKHDITIITVIFIPC